MYELSAERVLAVLNEGDLFLFGLRSKLAYSHFNLQQIGLLCLCSSHTEQPFEILYSAVIEDLLVEMHLRLLVLELDLVVEAAH